MNRGDTKQPGGGIVPIDKKIETPADKVKRFQELQELQPPVVKTMPEGVKHEAADVFRKGSFIPQFLKTIQQRIESSSVYQSFKLPGADYIVMTNVKIKRRPVRSATVVRDHDGGRGRVKGDGVGCWAARWRCGRVSCKRCANAYMRIFWATRQNNQGVNNLNRVKHRPSGP
jgi:hypothetical protein